MYNWDDNICKSSRLSNNSVLLVPPTSLTNKFFRISEKHSKNSNNIRRKQPTFTKRASIGDLSGIFGKSAANMSVFEYNGRKTVNVTNTSSTSFFNKTLIDNNPFAEVKVEEKEEEDLETNFNKNFKGKIPFEIIKKLTPEESCDIIKAKSTKLQNVYEEYLKSIYTVNQIKEKMKNLMADYERAKKERDILNAKFYEVKKQWELKKEKMTTEIKGDDILNQSVCLDDVPNHGPSLEEQIYEIEGQISKIKDENRNFYEEYDNLSEIYSNNKIQNSKLKESISILDLKIKQALQEKNKLEKLKGSKHI